MIRGDALGDGPMGRGVVGCLRVADGGSTTDIGATADMTGLPVSVKSLTVGKQSGILFRESWSSADNACVAMAHWRIQGGGTTRPCPPKAQEGGS